MPSLRRMQKAVVAHGVDDPEVLVAGGDFQNLFRGGQLNQRGVAHLGADTHDVVGVVLDDAGGLLAVGHGRGQAEQERENGVNGAWVSLWVRGWDNRGRAGSSLAPARSGRSNPACAGCRGRCWWRSNRSAHRLRAPASWCRAAGSSSSSRLGTSDSSNSSCVSFNWKISAYSLRSMLGLARKILVGQDSLTMCSMSEAAKFHHRLRRQDHGGVLFPPGFLGPHDPIADGLVLEKDPRLIDDEHLEGSGVRGLLDLGRCPLQDIKQQRLQNVRSNPTSHRS